MPFQLLSFIPRAEDVHFDIDEYLDRAIPSSQLHRLPRPISRFLGYRRIPKPDVGNVLIALWAIVGTFLGLLTVAAVFKYAPSIRHYSPPVLFASFVSRLENLKQYKLMLIDFLGRYRNSRIQRSSLTTSPTTQRCPGPCHLCRPGSRNREALPAKRRLRIVAMVSKPSRLRHCFRRHDAHEHCPSTRRSYRRPRHR
jgi:hypothetical protein